MQKVLLGIVCAVLAWGCQPDRQSQQIKTESEQSEQADSTLAQTPTYDNFGIQIDSLQVEQYKVKRNESLYLILDKFDFSSQEIYAATQEASDFVDIRSFKPGQKYHAYYSSADSSAELQHIVWEPNPLDYVVFDWQSDSLEIYKASRPLSKETVRVSGTINNSLYQTISSRNASPLLAYRLAQIFAWQIDFFGLREGDSFNVVYEKRYINDEFLGIGEIKAAEFTHRGEIYRAYQFNHPEADGYYTEEGESVQKALLKAPFEYNQRISSHYSRSRYHPTLKRRMPHNGVDFAAPRGTPVLSVGDGTVTEAQYRGANGNIVKVKHNSTYRTAYLHLQGFASGIHRGARVEQGQVIGYVGSTGRSTGPHLHYSLYKNDRHVNPMNVELPSSEAVPDDLMEEFKKVRDELERQLKADEDTVKEEKEAPVITVAK